MSETSEKPRLAAALAALERRARAELPRDSYSSLAGALELERGRRRRRRILVAALATGLPALATVVALALFLNEPPALCGFVTVSRSEDWRGTCAAAGEIAADRGAATLALDDLGMTIGVIRGTTVHREVAGVRVVAGRAVFAVEPRSRPSPVRVWVSHGVIEVVGTRFTVVQGGEGGSVQLESGSIKFVSSNGVAVTVSVGGTLRWPLDTTSAPPSDDAAAPRAPPPSESPGPGRSPPRAPDARGPAPAPSHAPSRAQDIVRQIEQMRIRHEYDELAEWLRRTLKETRSEPLRERLSFELSDVLIDGHAPAAAVCSHVADHLRRYPAGQYTEQLQRSFAAQRCPQ